MLLMKEPTHAPLPTEFEQEIAHGTAVIVPVRCGQLLSVTDVDGARAAQLFAFTEADDREFLSPHHTRVFSNSYVLGKGMRLVTNRRRPLMVLGKDNVGTHDLLMPASTTESLAQAGFTGHVGCREVVLAALADAGMHPIKVPDPVNLFLNVAVRQDATLQPLPSVSPAGGQVTCRVIMDCHMIVAACASDLGVSGGTGPIRVTVRNTL
jgi:uncharacterized protein YcgI (DUF1989 family)